MGRTVITYGDIPEEVHQSLKDKDRAATIWRNVGGKLFCIVTSHIPEEAFSKHDYAREFDIVRLSDRNVSTADMVAALEKHKPAGVLFTFLMNVRDEAIGAKAHELGVEAVSTWSVGYDHINVPQMTGYGIPVYHTPDVLTDAVALHTMTFITALAGNLLRADAFIKSGDWTTKGTNAAQSGLMIPDLFTWTIGIVGMGRIGTEVLYLLAPHGPSILWTDIDPNVRARAAELEKKYLSMARARGYEPTVRCVSLDELLKKSDLVTVHIDLNPTSRNLFNQENLSKMKEGAYFVNTARGAVADYNALYNHLASGHLAGAALDVFPQEPMSERDRRRVVELPNLLMTPHTASDRVKTRLSMWYLCYYALLMRLLGYRPTNVANPEVYR